MMRLLISIMFFLMPMSAIAAEYPLMGKALICVSEEANFRDRPLFFKFTKTKSEYIETLISFYYETKIVENKTHISEIRIGEVRDFIIRWFANNRPMCVDFLGCNSSLRMFQIDRNTLKLSSATPMVSGNVIYPIEDKYVEPYFGYKCDITTDFDKIDLLVKQTIEKNSAYYFDLYGIPPTKEERIKANEEKLKKRKI